jgi:c-di-AMP phosphodiesterase-like protein
MIFKSKAGVTFTISFIVWCIFTVGLIVVSFVVGNVWLAIVAGLFLLFFFYFMKLMRTKTFYEFAESYLFIKSGRYEQKIAYSDIIGVSRIKSMLMVPTTSSFMRLQIKHRNQSGMEDLVHLSPINENEFISLLESKLPV